MSHTHIVNICFTGFKKSGKTSVINSIANKEIFQVDANNHSTTVKCSEEWLNSDEGYQFGVTEMPGVDNGENGIDEKYFNMTCEDMLSHKNIIIWCSDINTAFKTENEINAVVKILNILNGNKMTKTLDDFTNYEFVIMLTKCNTDTDLETYNYTHNYYDPSVNIDQQQIENDNMYKRTYDNVNRLFNNPQGLHNGTKVMCFNAFGRMLSKDKYCKGNVNEYEVLDKMRAPIMRVSEKQYMRQYVKFNLAWFYSSRYQRNFKSQLLYFAHNYASLLNQMHAKNLMLSNYFLNVRNSLRVMNDGVNANIIFAFLCQQKSPHTKKLKDFLRDECGYTKHLSMAKPYDFDAIANEDAVLTVMHELKESLRYNVKTLQIQDKYRRLFDEYKDCDSVTVLKYWMLFGHSYIYYKKYYEGISNGHPKFTIKNMNGQDIVYDLSYKSFPFRGDNKETPSIKNTYVPLLAWYDFKIKEKDDVTKTEWFKDDCERLYANLYKNDKNCDMTIIKNINLDCCDAYENPTNVCKCKKNNCYSVFKKHIQNDAWNVKEPINFNLRRYLDEVDIRYTKECYGMQPM